jgi:hypothetical protein
MKKFLASKPAEYLAFIICLGVPTFLMWYFGLTQAFGVAIGSYVIVAVIAEWKKARIIHYAPLLAYILMVVFYAVRVVFEEKIFRDGKVDDLEVVIKYGVILLFAIPLLYNYNIRSLK